MLAGVELPLIEFCTEYGVRISTAESCVLILTELMEFDGEFLWIDLLMFSGGLSAILRQHVYRNLLR